MSDDNTESPKLAPEILLGMERELAVMLTRIAAMNLLMKGAYAKVELRHWSKAHKLVVEKMTNLRLKVIDIGNGKLGMRDL